MTEDRFSEQLDGVKSLETLRNKKSLLKINSSDEEISRNNMPKLNTVKFADQQDHLDIPISPGVVEAPENISKRSFLPSVASNTTLKSPTSHNILNKPTKIVILP